jgi:hypothetical protein
MERSPLPRSRLSLWALSVIAQTAKQADHRPVEPTPRLRLAMAWLSVTTDERQALEQFWQDAREVLTDRQTDYKNAYIRGTSLSLRLQGICERLGTDYHKITDHASTTNAEWP